MTPKSMLTELSHVLSGLICVRHLILGLVYNKYHKILGYYYFVILIITVTFIVIILILQLGNQVASEQIKHILSNLFILICMRFYVEIHSFHKLIILLSSIICTEFLLISYQPLLKLLHSSSHLHADHTYFGLNTHFISLGFCSRLSTFSLDYSSSYLW